MLSSMKLNDTPIIIEHVMHSSGAMSFIVDDDLMSMPKFCPVPNRMSYAIRLFLHVRALELTLSANREMLNETDVLIIDLYSRRWRSTDVAL